MLCIGIYFTDYGSAVLYKLDYMSPGWVTNVCYKNPITGSLYSPTMANIVQNARDHDGQKRDSVFWNKYVSQAHDSYVLK
jgi:hypothetical protein